MLTKTTYLRSFRLIFVFLLISSLSFAQQSKIDSLKSVLDSEKNEQKRLEVLKDLCLLLVYDTTLEQSETYIEEYVKLSKKKNDYPHQVEAHKIFSGFLINGNDKEGSIKEAAKAKDISLKTNNYEIISGAYANLGSIYSFDDIPKALEVFQEGIKIIEKANFNSSSVANLYIGVGNTLYLNYEEDEAIPNYLKALSIAEKFNNYEVQASALHSIGWIFTERKNPQALKYLELALSVTSKHNLPYYKALTNRALGRYCSDSNDLKKAITYQKESLAYFEQINSLINIFELNNNIAFSYLKDKNYKLGLNYAEKALNTSIELGDTLTINSAKITKADLLRADNQLLYAEQLLSEVAKDTINKKNWPLYMKEQLYESLGLLYKKGKNYEKGLFYVNKLSVLRDSLSKVRYNDKTESLLEKYQTEKKEKEILELQQKKTEQELKLLKESRNRQILIGGIAGLLLVLGIGSYYYKRNQRQKQQIENLQKELHHRIKNNLSVIDTFIEVAKEDFSESAYRNKLNELQTRIVSINEVHRQLYQNQDITKLNLKKYVNALAQNIRSMYHNFSDVNIIVDIDDKQDIEADKSFPVGLIINEFLTNSYKYAFEDKAGVITVKFSKDEQNRLELSDNGKGLPEDFNLKETESFGIRIMDLLSKQLKGTFSIKTDNGTKAEVIF